MIVLKILVAPFVVALTLLVAIVSFLYCVASALCHIGCVVLTLLALVLFIGGLLRAVLGVLGRQGRVRVLSAAGKMPGGKGMARSQKTSGQLSQALGPARTGQAAGVRVPAGPEGAASLV